MLVKVVNESTVKKPLRILSPQSGYVSSGAGRNERNPKDDPKIVERFLEVEVYKKPPLTEELRVVSGPSTPLRDLLDRIAARRPSDLMWDRGTRTSASAARPRCSST